MDSHTKIKESVMIVDIVGAGGFVGRALTKSMRKEFDKVRTWSSSKEESMGDFDLRDENTWEGLLNTKLDCVVLVSWPGLPNYDQSFHIEENLRDTTRLVDRLIASGAKKVVGIGTCFEYELKEGAISEESQCKPLTKYGQAKNQLRLCIEREAESANIEYAWFRLFYVYGKDQPKRTLLGSLIEANDSGGSVEVRDWGAKRDFIEIGEACTLIANLLKGGFTGVLNIGSGEGTDAGSMATKLKEKYELDNVKINGREEWLKNKKEIGASFWADTNKLNRVRAKIGMSQE